MARVSGCKGCDKRTPGCHGVCADYQAYHAERETIRNERAKSQTYADYIFESKRRERQRNKR